MVRRDCVFAIFCWLGFILDVVSADSPKHHLNGAWCGFSAYQVSIVYGDVTVTTTSVCHGKAGVNLQ